MNYYKTTSTEHTRLINCFIGLCKNHKHWPASLHKIGYVIQLIEQSISTKSNKRITPDVVAVSNKMLHALVVDCKSGASINVEQEGRYDTLQASDLADFVTVYDKNRLVHSICYAVSEKNGDKISNQTQKPIIEFGRRYVYQYNRFNKPELDNVLKNGINLDGYREPTSYYPFAPSDGDIVAKPYVLRAMLSYVVARRGVSKRHPIDDMKASRDLVKMVYPVHREIARAHVNTLATKINKITKDILKEKPELKEMLQSTTELNVKTLNRIQVICENMIAKYETQEPLDSYLK